MNPLNYEHVMIGKHQSIAYDGETGRSFMGPNTALPYYDSPEGFADNDYYSDRFPFGKGFPFNTIEPDYPVVPQKLVYFAPGSRPVFNRFEGGGFPLPFPIPNIPQYPMPSQPTDEFALLLAKLLAPDMNPLPSQPGGNEDDLFGLLLSLILGGNGSLPLPDGIGNNDDLLNELLKQLLGAPDNQQPDPIGSTGNPLLDLLKLLLHPDGNEEIDLIDGDNGNNIIRPNPVSPDTPDNQMHTDPWIFINKADFNRDGIEDIQGPDGVEGPLGMGWRDRMSGNNKQGFDYFMIGDMQVGANGDRGTFRMYQQGPDVIINGHLKDWPLAHAFFANQPGATPEHKNIPGSLLHEAKGKAFGVEFRFTNRGELFVKGPNETQERKVQPGFSTSFPTTIKDANGNPVAGSIHYEIGGDGLPRMTLNTGNVTQSYAAASWGEGAQKTYFINLNQKVNEVGIDSNRIGNSNRAHQTTGFAGLTLGQHRDITQLANLFKHNDFVKTNQLLVDAFKVTGLNDFGLKNGISTQDKDVAFKLGVNAGFDSGAK